MSTTGQKLQSVCHRRIWHIHHLPDLNFDYFKVTNYLKNLEDHQICDVGGALGLAYNVLKKSRKFPEDVVAAWLRKEDYVIKMSGEPTWSTLVDALRKVGQEGIARDIEAAEI